MQLFTVLKEGLQVLVLGLGITIIALALLILLIELINKLVSRDSFSKTNIEANVVDDMVQSPENNLDSSTDQVDDREIVAAISAAITMVLNSGDEPFNQPFRIKKIRKLPTTTPKWNQASRTEQLLNR